MFCEKCGHKLERKENHHKCTSCDFERYENPTPVVVPLIKVQNLRGEVLGLLGTIRGIEPQKGKLAYPGGFQEIESCHHALNREFFEETGLDLPELFKTHDIWEEEVIVKSTPDNRRNLMFFKCKYKLDLSIVDFEHKNAETQAIRLINIGDELAFPLHQECIEWGLK